MTLEKVECVSDQLRPDYKLLHVLHDVDMYLDLRHTIMHVH